MKRKNLLVAAFLILAPTLSFAASATAYEIADERHTVTALSTRRGTSVDIPENIVIDLCGDSDGCSLRMAMFNWDGTGRTASREALFYYNPSTKTWRSSWGDWAGTNNDRAKATQHIMQAWACYFTDGVYVNWANNGDIDANFALLSWDQYNATCSLTIID